MLTVRGKDTSLRRDEYCAARARGHVRRGNSVQSPGGQNVQWSQQLGFKTPL